MDLDYESPNITRMTLESDSCLIEHTALTEKYQNAVVPDNIYEELEGMLIDFVHIPFRTKFKLQKLYESPDNYLEMICSDCGQVVGVWSNPHPTTRWINQIPNQNRSRQWRSLRGGAR